MEDENWDTPGDTPNTVAKINGKFNLYSKLTGKSAVEATKQVKKRLNDTLEVELQAVY